MWRGLNKYSLRGFLGNERVVRSLLNQVETGKVASAILFTGPAGCGKKTLAVKLTQKLFCANLCEQCLNCVLLAKSGHPDFLVISPETDWLKLEQARTLKNFLATSPNTAPVKVAVLADSHRLTVEAGNSLLKVLEEPRATSICILTADSELNVLPTIVSRCQVYSLSPLPAATIQAELNQHNLSDDQRRFLTGFSEGVLGRALALLAGDVWQLRQSMAAEIKAVLTKGQEPLKFADSYQDYPYAIDLLEFWLRDMMLLKVSPGLAPLNRDFQAELEQCAAACSREKIFGLLNQCAQAREQLSAHASSRLVFACLALKMWEV